MVSAFVDPGRDRRTRLRLKIVDGEVKKNLYGGSRSDNDTANVDASIYRAVFEKIEQVIFVRKSLDAPAVVAAPVSNPTHVPGAMPAPVTPPAALPPAAVGSITPSKVAASSSGAPIAVYGLDITTQPPR